KGRQLGPRHDAVRGEEHPPAVARPDLEGASAQPRSPSPGHRAPRLCPERPAERIQVRSVRAVRRDADTASRGGDGGPLPPGDPGGTRATAVAGPAGILARDPGGSRYGTRIGS